MGLAGVLVAAALMVPLLVKGSVGFDSWPSAPEPAPADRWVDMPAGAAGPIADLPGSGRGAPDGPPRPAGLGSSATASALAAGPAGPGDALLAASEISVPPLALGPGQRGSDRGGAGSGSRRGSPGGGSSPSRGGSPSEGTSPDLAARPLAPITPSPAGDLAGPGGGDGSSAPEQVASTPRDGGSGSGPPSSGKPGSGPGGVARPTPDRSDDDGPDSDEESDGDEPSGGTTPDGQSTEPEEKDSPDDRGAGRTGGSEDPAPGDREQDAPEDEGARAEDEDPEDEDAEDDGEPAGDGAS